MAPRVGMSNAVACDFRPRHPVDGRQWLIKGLPIARRILPGALGGRRPIQVWPTACRVLPGGFLGKRRCGAHRRCGGHVTTYCTPLLRSAQDTPGRRSGRDPRRPGRKWVHFAVQFLTDLVTKRQDIARRPGVEVLSPTVHLRCGQLGCFRTSGGFARSAHEPSSTFRGAARRRSHGMMRPPGGQDGWRQHTTFLAYRPSYRSKKVLHFWLCRHF